MKTMNAIKEASLYVDARQKVKEAQENEFKARCNMVNALWDEMEGKGKFSTSDIALATGLPTRQVRYLLNDNPNFRTSRGTNRRRYIELDDNGNVTDHIVTMSTYSNFYQTV